MPRYVLATLLALFLALASPLGAADTQLADPKPDWNNPRKIVLQLTEAAKADGVLSNAVNIQKFYGQDNVKVAIVAYGNGVRALLKGESKVADRIKSLQSYEVDFVACGNTLETIKKSPADLIAGVSVAPAGIPEIVERTLQGWTYIIP
jgi:intracellular sulfur oxidation DsrE/DsrF family protein